LPLPDGRWIRQLFFREFGAKFFQLFRTQTDFIKPGTHIRSDVRAFLFRFREHLNEFSQSERFRWELHFIITFYSEEPFDGIEHAKVLGRGSGTHQTLAFVSSSSFQRR
jgi:hypothetical protein